MQDDGQTPSVRSLLLKYSQLGLSEKALVLNKILEDMLSEDTVAVTDTGDTTEVPGGISSEEVVLEQQVSSTGEVNAIQTTVSEEQTAEGQEEQDPTIVAGASEPIEDDFIGAMKADLDTWESTGNLRPEDPAATLQSEDAVIPEQAAKENDLSSDKQMSSQELDTAAKESTAEPASNLGEETTVPDKDIGAEVSHEHLDESTEDQPTAATSEPLAQASTEGQVPGKACVAKCCVCKLDP